jgi:hypothetical protein
MLFEDNPLAACSERDPFVQFFSGTMMDFLHEGSRTTLAL